LKFRCLKYKPKEIFYKDTLSFKNIPKDYINS
jgi:hypothetical protein